ncbi:hypothetical protein ACJJTC_014644 [Scirpophaga incertulas]
MLRLSILCILLAVVVAQSGYEYNKPGKPFGQGTTPNRSNYPGSNYPSASTTPSYSQGGQNGDYPGSTANYPSSPSGYQTGPSQGYPGATSQLPQSGYQGTSHQGSTSYPGQEKNAFPPSDYNSQGNTYSGQSQNTAGFNSNLYGGLGSHPQNPSRPIGPGFSDSSPFGPSFQGSPVFSGPGFDNGDNGIYENGDYSAIPGEPGTDYPILSEIPKTNFRCDAQQYPGYYADVETRCQVFYVCANNRTYSFLCPNGTIFSQEVFVCVWWNQFDCNSAPSYYGLNANLYDYSITGSSQVNYPGLSDYSQSPQGPDTFLPQGSSAQYPSNPGPSHSYPGSPSNSYPGSGLSNSGDLGSQAPQGIYEGNLNPSTTYPDNSGTSSGYSGGPQSQGPTSYPSSSRPQGPTSSYSGTDSHTPSSSYPTKNHGSTASYPGYPTSQSSSDYPKVDAGVKQGYPSGKPNGPIFPTDTHRPQGSSKPNREYLPPRN